MSNVVWNIWQDGGSTSEEKLVNRWCTTLFHLSSSYTDEVRPHVGRRSYSNSLETTVWGNEVNQTHTCNHLNASFSLNDLGFCLLDTWLTTEGLSYWQGAHSHLIMSQLKTVDGFSFPTFLRQISHQSCCKKKPMSSPVDFIKLFKNQSYFNSISFFTLQQQTVVHFMLEEWKITTNDRWLKNSSKVTFIVYGPYDCLFCDGCRSFDLWVEPSGLILKIQSMLNALCKKLAILGLPPLHFLLSLATANLLRDWDWNYTATLR